VSVNTTGEMALRRHRTAIDAAAKAGAERIVYTSHMGANPSSLFPPMPDHAATETALRESGVAFTALRNGFYATSALELLDAALETGELAVPEDGPVSWTAHADLAEAAAIALVEDVLDDATPALTGAEAIDMAGVAEIASELTGRPIRRIVVSDEDYRAGLVAHGLPEPMADMLVGLFAASRQGEFAQVDPTLTGLLGRRPVPLRDVMRAAIG
jgi:NAD(P)H dehydrogenase (quinone)